MFLLLFLLLVLRGFGFFSPVYFVNNSKQRADVIIRFAVFLHNRKSFPELISPIMKSSGELPPQTESEGGSIDREEDIIKHATEYYKNLFGPSESPLFSLEPDCWAPSEKITEVENSQLIKPFSEDEIKKVIKSMKKHSTRA
jgi:hypothetical protein